MPLGGLMVHPFPEPGPSLHAAMEQLQLANLEPPADAQAVQKLEQMPRPWDPGTCTGKARSELWTWLDQVAAWVNEQHLWNVTRPGIPECWPAHPHLVNDLAVLACTRHYTRFAVTPAALDAWHTNQLPDFLDRLRDRLGDGCQPAKHQPHPRHERDDSHRTQRDRRQRRYSADVKQAMRAATANELHQRW